MPRVPSIPDDVFEALVRSSGSERLEIARHHGVSEGYARLLDGQWRAIRMRERLGIPAPARPSPTPRRLSERELISAIQRGDA
jgi:hypothetical protein